ncbi:MAG: T9SS type A sorting domain-containing protein [Ferruginibacter sp.]
MFTSMLEGNYGVRLIDLDGRVVYSGTLSSSGSYNVQQINIPVIAAGIYKLEVVAPDAKGYTQKVIIN